MNKILLIVIAGVVIVGLVLLMMGVGSYNTLYAKREAVDAQWAEVQTQIQRRADLIQQLVGAVQGILTQEQRVFGDIAAARAGIYSAVQNGNREQVIEADNNLSAALDRLNFVSIVENYPQLKSNENVLRLQDSIEGTENRLAVARGDYNRTVQDYNTTRGRFPTVLIASLLGFEREDAYFKAQPGSERAPDVQLNQGPVPAPANR
jgi:LemA protein